MSLTALLHGHGRGGLCWTIACCLDLFDIRGRGWKDFPPKALLPSRRAEIPSNRYSQLRLTTETQDSREEGEKRKINEKSGDRGKGNEKTRE